MHSKTVQRETKQLLSAFCAEWFILSGWCFVLLLFRLVLCSCFEGGWCFGFLFCFGWFWFFETGFLYVALAVLELTVDQAGLQLRDPPASAFSAGITGVCHHCPAHYFFMSFYLDGFLSLYCLGVFIFQSLGEPKCHSTAPERTPSPAF